MNKQFVISGIVISVLGMALDFVVHGLLLDADYTALPSLYRTMEDSGKLMPYMLLAHVLIGFGFTWIYRQGVSATKPVVAQGVRFGFAVAVLSAIPGYMIYYTVMPLPEMMVVKQCVFDTVRLVMMGVAVAALNKPVMA